MLRIRLLMPLLAVALAATCAWSQENTQSAPTQTQTATGDQAASSPHRPAGIMYMRGAGPVAKSQNIPYLGGAVFPNPTVYVYWWGEPADFPFDYRDGIDEIFQHGFNASPYLALANQYLFGQTANIRFGGDVFDYSAPPAQDPTTPEVVAEVCKVLRARGLKPDPTALYAVYTSNFPPQKVYCAWHDFDPCPDGTRIHLMFMPNANDYPPCWVQPPELSCNGHSNGLQAAANSTAHELMESITDPNVDAWVSLPTYNEIGDPCSFVYKSCVNLADETVWQLQEIWSNRVSACVQGAGNSIK